MRSRIEATGAPGQVEHSPGRRQAARSKMNASPTRESPRPAPERHRDFDDRNAALRRLSAAVRASGRRRRPAPPARYDLKKFVRELPAFLYYGLDKFVSSAPTHLAAILAQRLSLLAETSSSVAMSIPGVVIASAPCAARNRRQTGRPCPREIHRLSRMQKNRRRQRDPRSRDSPDS